MSNLKPHTAADPCISSRGTRCEKGIPCTTMDTVKPTINYNTKSIDRTIGKTIWCLFAVTINSFIKLINQNAIKFFEAINSANEIIGLTSCIRLIATLPIHLLITYLPTVG